MASCYSQGLPLYPRILQNTLFGLDFISVTRLGNLKPENEPSIYPVKTQCYAGQSMKEEFETNFWGLALSSFLQTCFYICRTSDHLGQSRASDTSP